MLTVGSLFSGIGGFDLGLERAGMRTQWFCERDAFCRSVLAKHWPGVPRFVDIERIGIGRDFEPCPVDVICGGFPCQDLSYAGRQAGIDGARSGLWSEYARLVGELRPRYVVVENVSALRRHLGRVLGDLAALGYDAEWDCIPASAIGAPHQRDRIWLVAYPMPGHSIRAVADTRSLGWHRDAGLEEAGRPAPERGEAGDHAQHRDPSLGASHPHWDAEPDVGRVADGVPARLVQDRLRALGNALVPQVAEWVGRRIVDHEGAVDVAA